MYGSFAAGEADEHSDIEFWLFFTEARLAEVDPHGWCSRIAPLSYGLLNEFGSYVAFFPGLVRGEFHFATVEGIAEVAKWPARGAEVERMVLVDRRGRCGRCWRGCRCGTFRRWSSPGSSRSTAIRSRTGWCWRST
ncbi:hypothetical protein ACFQ2M_00480 [Kitasatospora saccharophila]|uniref:hypothetical protein n=1 Tax=Kitasatospora saccharophila TaxID=407973 RepID=UPI0036255EA1